MKPPYVIPSMQEISALPFNGKLAISLFSGCGGSSLGYRMAGFRVLYANEFVPAAVQTYKANAPIYTWLDDRDIRVVQSDEILKAIGCEVGEIDLFDGSPPCASFSSAGKREKGWNQVRKYSDVEQRTDDLFDEYLRLRDALQPKVFVAENVSGLIKGAAKGYFLDIMERMQKGYLVECRVLDAQWLGVPQRRQRTIFVGVREDLGKAPAHPTPLPYRYKISDVLPHIIRAQVGSYNGEWQSADQPMSTIVASDGSRSHRSQVVTKNGINRQFTIDELKTICSFPSDFVLTGSYEQQWERLGRSVPPLMMKAIATTIAEKVFA